MMEIKLDTEGFATALKNAALDLQKAEEDYRAIIDKQKIAPADFAEYENQIKKAGTAYDTAKEQYEKLLEADRKRTREAFAFENCINALESIEGSLVEYDSNIMKQTVEKIRIYSDKTAIVEFMSGIEVKVEI